MAIQTKSFSTIVGAAVAAVQGSVRSLIDMAVGSIGLALLEAAAGIGLWLQAIALQIAALTRFSTSSGTDADSWGADYGFKRLPPIPATGQVTFARFTATAQATVPAATASGTDDNGNTIWTGGFVVQTADGTQQYMVIPDTTQGAYNSGLNAYVLPANTSSITATVVDTVAGSAGNVGAALINTMGEAISGVDTVSNALAFTSGADAELDTAFKARFVLYLESLTEGTKAACQNAVSNIQQGAVAYITENYTVDNVYQPGYFYAICDDGTGHPSSGFLSQCYAAIDAVRAEGTTFAVLPPTLITANVSMVLTLASGYALGTVGPLVASAITTYINALPGGGTTLPWSRLAQIAYDTSPGVTNVTGVLLNSGTADVTSTPPELIKAGSVSVT